VAEDGELSDAAVLELDVPEAIESVLVLVEAEVQGIPESEGLLGSSSLSNPMERAEAAGARPAEGAKAAAEPARAAAMTSFMVGVGLKKG